MNYPNAIFCVYGNKSTGIFIRDVSEIFRTVRVRFEIPAFEPVRTCLNSRIVRTVPTAWTV